MLEETKSILLKHFYNNLINDDLESSSSDNETESDSDNETDNESESQN